MRVLVTYASKCGSTHEIAQHIGHLLENAGFAVDVLWAGQKHMDLARYDAVVVGSAIRVGRWLPEAVHFVERNQQILRQIPVAYFAVCITMEEDSLENRQIALSYLQNVRAMVEPVSIGLFAGVIDVRKLNILEKLAVRLVRAPQGDHRNWSAIHDWTEHLEPLLKGQEEIYSPLPA